MAKFKFELTAGRFVRSDIRIDLERSKEKLEYLYPGSRVSIREEKQFWDSVFYVQGINFPDTSDFIAQIKNWENKIRKSCDEL